MLLVTWCYSVLAGVVGIEICGMLAVAVWIIGGEIFTAVNARFLKANS